MAKTFTISGGHVVPGIRLEKGALVVGEAGRGRKLVTVPLPGGPPPCPNRGRDMGVKEVEVASMTTYVCPLCGQTCGENTGVYPIPLRHPDAGVCQEEVHEVPVSGPGGDVAAVVLVRDHSGFRGGWLLRGARTPQEWDAIISPVAAQAGHTDRPTDRPHGCRVIAEGWCGQGAAGRMGGGPEYLLVIPEGVAVEIVRHGRLYGAPSVIRITNVGGELLASDPRAEAGGGRVAPPLHGKEVCP